MSITSIVTK